MALIDNWNNFIRIHGGIVGARDVFERLMDELLRAENPGKEVHIVEAVQGDGGIDVYVRQPGGIDVYQCKFFMDEMDASQWAQVRGAFDRIIEFMRSKTAQGITLQNWYLCMPREMRKEDLAKWEKFCSDRESFAIGIKLIDGNEIIQRLQTCDRLSGTNFIERYFVSHPNSLPKCFLPMPAVPEINLIGREYIIQQVIEQLNSKEGVALISGLGGIGKTAVMQEIYEMIRKDGDERSHVAWITCGDSLEEDLLLLKDSLGIMKDLSREDAIQSVITKLRTFEGSLYLLLDDMGRVPDRKEISLLKSLYPHVRTMITSRQKIKGVSQIDIAELDEDKALDLFYGYYAHDPERKYEEVVKRIVNAASVKRHTLLTELLAKAAAVSFETLDVFYLQLEEKGFFAVSEHRFDTVHDENKTIEESVIRLYDMAGLSQEQQKIMRLFSIFSPEKVIYGKIEEWAGFSREDVDGLVRQGWLERTETGFIIHQIIRDSLKRQMQRRKRQGRESAWAGVPRIIGNLLNGAAQEDDGELRIEEYGGLLDKITDTKSYLSLEIGYAQVRERLVLTEDVAGYFEDRIEGLLSKKTILKREKKILVSAGAIFKNTAAIYEDQGEHRKALRYYMKALPVYERLLGLNHPDTGALYHYIAAVYGNQGEYDKALDYYRKALTIRECVFGTAHPETGVNYNDMAMVYANKGEYKKALEYFEKALAVFKQAHCNDYLNIGAIYDNMATVFQNQGEYPKALACYNKSMAIRERMLGQDHFITGLTYNNMAIVYYCQGEYAKAKDCYERALSIFEQVLSEEHYVILTVYNNMVLLYTALGEYEKAMKYSEQALTGCENVLGPNNPITGVTYHNLAGLYKEQGEYRKAQDYYEKAMSLRERVLGQDHPDTSNTYNDMAELYTAQGNYEKALDYLGKALSIRERALGLNHPDTGTTYNDLGVVYTELRDYTKAMELYGKALSIREQVLGTDHPSTGKTYFDLAGLYEDMGDCTNALEYYEKAFSVFKKRLGIMHRYTVEAQDSIRRIEKQLKSSD